MPIINPAGELPHGGTTHRIIRELFDVHGELGHGFSEIVYRRALGLALRQAGLAVLDEVLLPVDFRGHRIGHFRADLVVDRAVLVEVKALREIDAQAEAQLINYLKAAGGGVGMVLNFGRSATFKRRVFGDPTRSLPNLATDAAQSQKGPTFRGLHDNTAPEAG